MKNPFEDIRFKGIIEEREESICNNCGEKTIYFDLTSNVYICSIDCGEEIELYGVIKRQI